MQKRRDVLLSFGLDVGKILKYIHTDKHDTDAVRLTKVDKLIHSDIFSKSMTPHWFV